ncbi:hypothetical protein ACG9IC_002710 [Listeria monocytogenes]
MTRKITLRVNVDGGDDCKRRGFVVWVDLDSGCLDDSFACG